MKKMETSAISSSNAPQPIDEYIEILQSNNSVSIIRSVLLKALSDPLVYVGFAELRSTSTVVTALQESPAGKALLNTLDLFSYGTYRQYTSVPEGTYIILTAPQLAKLKALTVVTIVQQRCDEEATSSIPPPSMQTTVVRSSRRNRRLQALGSTMPKSACRIIPYSVLQDELDIIQEVEVEATDDNHDKKKKPSIRPLEDLLIHCIYSHLLPVGTKLDQRNKALVINLSSQSASSAASNESNHVLCRDVNVEADVTDMISKLEAFCDKGKKMMIVLNKCNGKVTQDAVNDSKKWRSIEKSINETKENIQNVESVVNEDSMRMLIEGDVLGEPSGTSSFTSSSRSERKVKRSRGWLRGGNVGRIS